ncbi:hypothetical protein B4Q13_15040 [Lacticaseibacillus rhamnosus]
MRNNLAVLPEIAVAALFENGEESLHAVPIVRKTGGLADSVIPYDPASGHGTGIVFEHFDSEALEWALNTALDLYAQPAHWARMVRNGMAQDFSMSVPLIARGVSPQQYR